MRETNGKYGKYGVRVFRKRANLTQREAADQLGMRMETYCQKEKGKSAFDVPEAVKMAEMYHMTLEDVGEVFFNGALSG